GKPYAGKPHVRIDEGEGKYYILLTLLYSTVISVQREDALVSFATNYTNYHEIIRGNSCNSWQDFLIWMLSP
ncbi:MAG TPA: hypothetical protein VKA49_00485, partial [Flavitalea sp.]|nr:hypothetical protein [Flavitalea sp.]